MPLFVEGSRVRFRSVISVLLLAVAVGGCKNTMFAPRTGEIFQTTRMGPGFGAFAYMLPTVFGLGIAAEADCPILGIPIAILGLPIAAVGFVADECVVSPIVDMICLPYDLCQSNHGFYIRIVDEDDCPLSEVSLEGTLIHDLGWDAEFSGRTNSAGEFYVSRLSFERGWFRGHMEGRPDWWDTRSVKAEELKPGPDGRYVFTFKMLKTTPGGWKAKTDGAREDLLMKVLPGKWSADAESRAWIRNEYKSSTADDRSAHWIELRTSGAAHRCDYGAIVCDDEKPKGLDCTWTLERNGKVEKEYDEPATWTWRARFSWKYEDSTGTFSKDYYLGEDEKGLFLSPGPFSSGSDCQAIMKFRKVQ